jgi:hypothetical protein
MAQSLYNVLKERVLRLHPYSLILSAFLGALMCGIWVSNLRN